MKGSRGQALIEFALVAPLFLAAMLGLVELTLVYSSAAFCQAAAAEAAHMVALSGASTSTIDQRAVLMVTQRSAGFVTVHVTQVEIDHVDATGTILAANTYNSSGSPIGSTGWSAWNRASTASAPLNVQVRITYTEQWITSFLGASGATLTIQVSGTAMAPSQGG